MRDFTNNIDQLAINSATVKQWPLEKLLDGCQARGIRAVTPWREDVEKIGIPTARRWFSDAGIVVSGYCRGGFFTYANESERQKSIDSNLRSLDEAAEMGALSMALVVGGLPNGSKDLASARSQVAEGIATLLERAKAVKIPLLIEPLHPMYAADRACVNSLRQALDLCDLLDPEVSGYLGIAYDVYHLWWDPELRDQTRRGASRLMAFHVCDWLVPTRHLFTDRGMMGDGVIDIPALRGWVEDTGYRGLSEVEIFSAENWWTRDGNDVLDTCIARHQSAV